MNKICAHMICRYEPFIVYAVESVINYVDKMLIYETGSRNAPFADRTIEDCEMLALKYPDKIVFKEIPIDDETPWSVAKYNQFRQYMAGKKCKGEVRRQQILDTPEEFTYCWIVDADEIYYEKDAKTIKEELCQKIWGKVENIRVPIRWFYDTTHYFEGYGANRTTGRFFLTAKTDMVVQSPGELHMSKTTGRPFSFEDMNMMVAPNLGYMTHWEGLLKRWRRIVPGKALVKYDKPLPEVMVANSYYIERFEKELKVDREKYFVSKQKELGL